jgi:hypothetical protein
MGWSKSALAHWLPDLGHEPVKMFATSGMVPRARRTRARPSAATWTPYLMELRAGPHWTASVTQPRTDPTVLASRDRAVPAAAESLPLLPVAAEAVDVIIDAALLRPRIAEPN